MKDRDASPRDIIDAVIANGPAGLRIGHLLPIATDYWWELSSIDEAAAVGPVVATALRTHALPFLESVKTPADILVDNPLFPDWLRLLPPSEMHAEALALLGREAEAQAMRQLLAEMRRKRRGEIEAT